MVFWRPPEVGDESRYANPEENSKNRNQPPHQGAHVMSLPAFGFEFAYLPLTVPRPLIMHSRKFKGDLVFGSNVHSSSIYEIHHTLVYVR